jgi:hypothetical protein
MTTTPERVQRGARTRRESELSRWTYTLDEAQWLIDGGTWPPSAAQALGVSPSAIIKRAQEFGRHDLADAFRPHEREGRR